MTIGKIFVQKVVLLSYLRWWSSGVKKEKEKKIFFLLVQANYRYMTTASSVAYYSGYKAFILQVKGLFIYDTISIIYQLDIKRKLRMADFYFKVII